jgi:hypothetical protein
MSESRRRPLNLPGPIRDQLREQPDGKGALRTTERSAKQRRVRRAEAVRLPTGIAMTLTEVRTAGIGALAGGVRLRGVDGRTYTLQDASGPKGTLVAFICNHCPYVTVIVDRLIEDADAAARFGIGTIAVMPNDAESYPQDSFASMQAFAHAQRLPFPYVIDETQTVTRILRPRCTPDFFGFNALGNVAYHGRLDTSRTTPVPGARRELRDALRLIAESGRGPAEQHASVGCSIKWKE